MSDIQQAVVYGIETLAMMKRYKAILRRRYGSDLTRGDDLTNLRNQRTVRGSMPCRTRGSIMITKEMIEKAECDRLREINKELVEALKPFSEMADAAERALCKHNTDDILVKLGSLRSARAALSVSRRCASRQDRKARGSRPGAGQISDRGHILRSALAGSSAVRQGGRLGGSWSGALYCRSYEAAERD